METFPAPILPSTRETALQRAREFAPLMGHDYARGRNHVIPGHPHVSKLAASVRVRLISENELARICLEEHGTLARCEKFVQEIHWRSYWRSWLETRPEVWSEYQSGRDLAREKLNKAQLKRIEQIENGTTGVGVMDNFARELVQTGYLHNHARMWFAAFWIHTERLPYELGADFFDRHLVCACPASNTLSWRWVAGLQTRGKTYLVRRSNVEKYCDAAYLEDGLGLERLEKPQSAPFDENYSTPNAHIPSFALEPPKTAGKFGIWISEDDLAPETSLLRELKPSCVALSLTSAPPKSDSSNGLRREFRLEAMRDAAARAKTVWQAETTEIEAATPEDLAARLEKWARDGELKSVVALKPFVGPSSDALPALETALSKAGIQFHWLRRAEDARVLGAAERGYFKFWSAVKAEMV